MIIKKIIKYLLIYASFLTTFNFFLRNYNGDILRLVFAFVAFVGSFPISGSAACSLATSGSAPGSGVDSRAGIYWK